MILAATEALASSVKEENLNENHILPTMDEWEVYPKVAAKIASKAVSLGVARKKCLKKNFTSQPKNNRKS